MSKEHERVCFHVQNREELGLGAMLGQADHVNDYVLLMTFEG
jgi:hypothetical protein